MKRTVYIILVLLVMLCVFPTVAFANAPEPIPNDHDILLDGHENIGHLIVYGIDADGNREIFKGYSSGNLGTETKRRSERIIGIYNKDEAYQSIQLAITNMSGETMESNVVELTDWTDYIYDVEGNNLYAGDILSRKPRGFTVVFWGLALLFPLGLTVLLEWLTAQAFRIKPSKYVCYINLITNPIMNIIILIACTNYVVNYLVLVVMLELIVLGLEFLYYKSKYSDISNKRLLLFTVVANAVSWGAYAILNNVMYFA